MTAEIAKKIKDLRRVKNFTQTDLALASGVSFGAIQKLESGEKNVRFDTLASLIEAMGVTLSEFFSDGVQTSAGLSKDFSLRPVPSDVLAVGAQFLSVEPGRRAMAAAILFDDSSLAREADRQALRAVLPSRVSKS